MARLLSSTHLKALLSSSQSFKLQVVASGSVLQQCLKYSTNGDSDTHDDFRPTTKLDRSGISLKGVVEKGVPEAPRCGFSALATKILQHHNAPITSRNILDNPQLKEGVKAFRSILSEDEYNKLADETLHDLQEKFEEYGDEIQVDGFDIDYGNNVLTLKLGDMGTYVMNKQTPNRQIWLSSPVSGPSRFDWDMASKNWIYRRTKANLFQLLEEEVAQLCGKPISLS